MDVTLELSVLSDYNGVDISCNGYNDGIILANAGGGSGIYTFDWFSMPDSSDDIQTNITTGFDTLFLSVKENTTLLLLIQKDVMFSQ